MRWIPMVAGVLAVTPFLFSGKPNVAEPGDTVVLDIAARVDGEPIYVAEVHRALKSVARRRPSADVGDERLFVKMLQQIVRRRLVIRRLMGLQKAASKYEIEQAFVEKRSQWKRQGASLDDKLAEAGINQQMFRRNLMWTLSWKKYCTAMLDDDHLKAYFDSHRREYDGTEVQARHILLSLPKASVRVVKKAQERDLEKIVRRANKVRQQIIDGELSFDDAAQKHSTAPSRDMGGDLGFFPRRGVMHEVIAAAAFALKPGEISPPIVSPFGVHLIEVTDERSGDQPWAESREALYKAASRDHFNWLADKQKSESHVEIIWQPKANSGE